MDRAILAGLTGLSAGMALEGKQHVAFERDPPPVLSANERAQLNRRQTRETLRRFSLTQMLRGQGIRRSVSNRCKCGKPISANKSACLAHLPVAVEV